MGLVLKLFWVCSMAFSQMHDANHETSPDQRVFKKANGEEIVLDVGDKTCESLADGKFEAAPVPEKKGSPKSAAAKAADQIKISIECKDGKRISMSTKDQSGEMMERWKEGQREGTMKKVNAKGVTIYEANYVNGIKEGEEKTYLENGTISTLRRYKKGQLAGEQIDYDSFGKPSLKFTPRALKAPKNKMKLGK